MFLFNLKRTLRDLFHHGVGDAMLTQAESYLDLYKPHIAQYISMPLFVVPKEPTTAQTSLLVLAVMT